MFRTATFATLLAVSVTAAPLAASTLWPDFGGRPTLRLQVDETTTAADRAALDQRIERMATTACQPAPAALGINQPGAGAPWLESAMAECVEATRDGARLIPNAAEPLMSAQ
ncbi:MAG: hypothetical protein SNJ63_03820 [Sphingomonadaceae bacterium]